MSILAATTAGGPTHGAPKITGGPIAAAVLFLIILAGLVIYGSTNLRTASVLDDATTGQSIPAPMPPAYLFPASPNLQVPLFPYPLGAFWIGGSFLGQKAAWGQPRESPLAVLDQNYP